MTKFQTIAVIAALLFSPVSGWAGWEAASWTLAHRHADCNTQAREWLARFPANQPLATMPAFSCVKG